MSTNQSKRPRPDAVATKFGWAIPKTGELLVSIRGLDVEVHDYKPNRPFTYVPPIARKAIQEQRAKPVEEQAEEILSVEDEPEETLQEDLKVTQTPKKRGRKPTALKEDIV